MTIPEIIVFLVIIMYVRRDIQWSKHKLIRLRVLILNGHFKTQISVMEGLFRIDGKFLAKILKIKVHIAKIYHNIDLFKLKLTSFFKRANFTKLAHFYTLKETFSKIIFTDGALPLI